MDRKITAVQLERARQLLIDGDRTEAVRAGVEEAVDRLLWNYDANNPLVQAYVLAKVIDEAASRLSSAVLDYQDGYGNFVGAVISEQRALLAELLDLANEAVEDAADGRLYDERMSEDRGEAFSDD